MKTPRLPLVLMLAAAIGAAAPSARGAPFANGSFEDPGISVGTEAAIGTVSAWTGTGAGLRYLKDGNSHSGAAAVDGTHLVSFGHDGAIEDELSQTFDTVPGKGYAVNFWFTAIDSADDDFQFMQVEAFDGANSLATPEMQFMPFVGGQWSQGKTYSFTATSTSTTLIFKDMTSPLGGGETGNWALDDVTVTEISYPPGTVLAWGSGSAASVPAGLAGVKGIAAGQSHALALKYDGSVVAWGNDGVGQATVPEDLGAVKAVAACGNHSLVLLEDGTVRGWGEDYGDRAPSPGLNGITAITDGFYFSAALRGDGTVAVWGDFDLYGPGVDPSPILGWTGVKAIAAGYNHLLALKQDGSVVAWGVEAAAHTAVPPEAATTVKAVAAGSMSSFAIKEDGTVILWGEAEPLPEGLANVAAIGAGEAHWLAARGDGSVEGWGDPSSGQLNLPPGLANVSQLAAGITFSMALTQPASPLPDPLEFTVVTKDPGEPWTFTAKFPNQSGLYLRVQSTLTPDEEGTWTDLDGGGMMDLLNDGEEENWQLETSNLPLGLRHFRVIAAASGWIDSKLVYSIPLKVESPAGPILYTQGSALSRTLMLMESDGSDQVALTDGSLNPLQCALSPGGIRAAFVTLDGELYVMMAQPMDAVDNVPVNVIEGAPVTANISSTMAWSPDGKRLAFAADDNKVYVLQVVGDAAEITPYDVSTNPLTAVVDTLSSAPNPAWSPDGRHLALLGANYIQVFQIMDGAGAITPQGPGNPLVALTDSNDFSTAKWSAAWSPDGQHLAFVEENVTQSTSFISILHARNGVGVLTPEGEGNERLPLYEATDTPLAETVSWSRDGSLLAVGAKDGFTNYVEVFKPELVDDFNPRVALTGGGIEDGAFQPSFGGAFMSTPPPDDDLPPSTEFHIVRGLPGLPWTFSILQTSTLPSLTLRVESTLTPGDDGSWEDLPGGSLMERDGDLWTLLSSEIPVGNRYFRVVTEADGFPPQVVIVETPYLVEREVVDNTPPTLAITHAWIEKINAKNHYRMYLDPRDETGFDATSTIFVRTGADVGKLQPFWRQMPWTRGQPISELFTGASIAIEVYAQDAAGNKSTVQRRVFKAPLPVTTAPNIEPRFAGIIPFAENAIDCRGLFAGDFDGLGVGDDVLQIDRGSGEVRVRRQGDGGVFTDNSFFLTPGGINDCAVADLNGDGRPDLVVVVDSGVKVFYNDGPDGDDTLQFTESIPAGLSNIALPNVSNCAVGDVTGEGKPDIVLTGTTGPGDAVVAVLVNDDDGEFTAATAIAAGPGLTPGLVKVGDVDGDGWPDAVMVDGPGNQLVIFRNKGEGDLAGFVEPDPEYQPKKVATGHQFTPLSPKALAVGDVTGDGRADAVVVMHWFVSTNPGDPNDTRDHQVWQLLDAQPDGSLHANELFDVSQGPQAATGTDYRSDVLLQDLNGDRFPELIFTSQFEDAPPGGSSKGGILAIRLNSQLDEQNKLLTFDITETPVPTDAGNPHRLAAGRYGRDTRKGIILANGSNPQLQWIPSGFSITTKAQDLAGGLETQSNPEGTEAANGVLSYFEYPGGYIDFSITYANNTVNPFTNATVESQLPATLELIPAETDPGYVLSGAAAARIIRWTETIPAGSAGVKHFRARVLGTVKPGSTVSPKVTFKGGGKTLTAAMPKVTVQEPILLEWASVQSFSDASGNTARLDDTLVYRARVTNLSPVPVANTVLTMAIPTGTIYDDLFQDLPGIVKVVSTDKKKVTFTITTLNPGLSTPIDPRVDVLVKGKAGSVVKATMTALRPSGLKRTLPEWPTNIANSLEIKVTADKNIARPGDLIEYTVRAKNWGSSPLTGARVVNAIPFGTKLWGARIRAGANYPNYLGDEEPELLLDEDTVFGDHPGYIRGAKPYLFWDIGDIPGGAEILMRYRVIVGVDVPTEYYPGGKYTQIDITNTSFNFTALTGTSLTRSTAFPPSSTANKQPGDLLPKNPATGPKTTMSAEDPLPKPKLTLQKTVIGGRDESVPDWWKYRLLPMQMNGAVPTYFVINDPKKTSDGRVTFLLCVSNSGTAKAEDVFIRDVVPEGFVFEGFLGINGQLNLAQDLHLSQFYDKAGKQLAADPAQFPNYRSFDLLLGDLNPGEIKTFYYQAYTTKAPSIKPISSLSGGLDGITNPKVNGLTYTSKPGYFVKSRELHFPVNGQPAQLDLIIGDPLVVNFPVAAITSRSGLELGQQVEIKIPYEITGGVGLAVDPTMTFTVPKGYKIEDLSLLVANPQTMRHEVQDTDIEIKDTTAGKEVKMKLGNNRIAFPTVRLSFDTADTAGFAKLRLKGFTVNPLNFFATITGGFAPASGSGLKLAKFGVPLTAGETTVGNLRKTSTPVQVDARSDPAKDSAVFVGRCAPMFVRRGKEFTYTIFVGNQTAMDLGTGVISMRVPNGCVAKKATLYKLNAHVDFGDGSTTEASGIYQFGKITPSGTPTPVPPGAKVSEITWKTPIKNALVSWDISEFNPSEAGVVTLTVMVDENYLGDRIDDDTCWFRVANAMDKTAGPLGVVVLPKNDETAAPEVLQKSIEGMGLKYTTDAGDALAQKFRVGTNSCGITIGGANYAQLEDSTVIIMLPKGRVMAIGQPHKIDDYDQSRTFTRIVHDSPELRIVVGAGTASEQSDSTILPDGVVLINAPGYQGTRTANSILADFVKSGVSLLSKRKVNIVIGGGPTLVLTGANTLAGADLSGFLVPPAPTKDGVPPVPLALPAHGVLSHNGNAIVAGGGGNIVAGGGGNIVAGGGGNIVAGGGGNVVANDGAGIVAGGGGNIVAAGGGNLIPATVSQPGRIVAAGGGNIVAGGGGNIVAGGGGNIVAGGGGNALPR